MPLPRLAIVGRPNVGKSSLMNMLAHRKVSIVDPTPGVTRDRVSAIVELEPPDPEFAPLPVELTDTGGYGVYTAEGRRIDDAGHDLAALTRDIERQIAQAIDGADLILFVVDAQAGVTPQDEEIARLMRQGGLGHVKTEHLPAATTKSGKVRPARTKNNVVIVGNKCDGPRWEAHLGELASLGFGEPLAVSARNNYMRREFTGRLYDLTLALTGGKRRRLDEPRERRAPTLGAGAGAVPGERPPELMLAMVGKRNAGKSSLVNALAGEERMIVSEIPGTTRDAVDVRFEFEGKSFVAIDTAGLRKKKSFQDRVEWFALDRMQQAVRRCDVALFLVDATEPISQVDQQVGKMLADSYKPVVITVNKWDLAEGRPLRGGAGRAAKKGARVTPEVYEDYLRKEFKGLDHAPISFMSAREGTNVRETVDLAFELQQQAHARTTTGKLNRLLREIIGRQGPSSGVGAFTKVFYVSQVAIAPPTIVLIVNKPELFTPNYQRFLLNRLREELPYPEVPIRLLIRARRQREDLPDLEAPDLDAQAAAFDRTLAAEAEETAGSDDAGTYFDEPILLSGPGAHAPPTRPAAGAEDDEESNEVLLEIEPEDAPMEAPAAGGPPRRKPAGRAGKTGAKAKPAARPAGRGKPTKGGSGGPKPARGGSAPAGRAPRRSPKPVKKSKGRR